MSSIFEGCMPLVANWVKFGEPQVFEVLPKHEVYYTKGFFGDNVTCRCNNKILFSIPLSRELYNHNIISDDIKKITAQQYIKCYNNNMPIIEDNKCTILTRIIDLE